MAADGPTSVPLSSAQGEGMELDEAAMMKEIDAALERIHRTLQRQHADMDALLVQLARPAS